MELQSIDDDASSQISVVLEGLFELAGPIPSSPIIIPRICCIIAKDLFTGVEVQRETTLLVAKLLLDQIKGVPNLYSGIGKQGHPQLEMISTIHFRGYTEFMIEKTPCPVLLKKVKSSYKYSVVEDVYLIITYDVRIKLCQFSNSHRNAARMSGYESISLKGVEGLSKEMKNIEDESEKNGGFNAKELSKFLVHDITALSQKSLTGTPSRVKKLHEILYNKTKATFGFSKPAQSPPPKDHLALEWKSKMDSQ